MYSSNGDLFAIESNLEIVALTKHDVIRKTDKVDLFCGLIKEHEGMYPDIKAWFQNKVLPGIENGNRKAYYCLNNDEPIATAIVKIGRMAKFCHLHIREEERNRHLGDLFFSKMAMDVKRIAKEVHFTVPETLWVEKKTFFQSFGFAEAKKATRQYRAFEDELKCSASFDTVWEKVLEKIPVIIQNFTKGADNIFNGLVISIKPQHVKKIEKGEKLVEIRKKFNAKWINCRATIYSSSPEKKLHGHARISDVIKKSPGEIWEKFGSEIGCSKEDFNRYTETSSQVYAILLKDYQAYTSPLYLSHLSYLLQKDLTPPQSHLSLEKSDLWVGAVSVAELLHGRFQLRSSGLFY
jgi:predicted transcriptional regulator/N-acetylglutamate synthase-like GNAT family acetyltransferase